MIGSEIGSAIFLCSGHPYIGPEGHSTLSHKTEYMNLTNCVSYHIIKHIHTNEVITLVITFNTCNKHTNVVLAFMPT